MIRTKLRRRVLLLYNLSGKGMPSSKYLKLLGLRLSTRLVVCAKLHVY